MLHFLEFFFWTPHTPFYKAAVWGNVVAVVPCGILAVMWSRSKTAATHALLRQHHAEDQAHQALVLAHAEHQSQLAEEQHWLAYTGRPHPRVEARRAAGEHPTPKRKDPR